MKLSPHFSLDEFCASQSATRAGIDNELPPELFNAAVDTAEMLERIRALVNAPIIIDSGYRCVRVNELVGSEPTSQHIRAEAADIRCPTLQPRQLAKIILAAKASINYDQLILEYPDGNGWVHVSFTAHRMPRGQELTKRLGRSYEKGIL